MRYTFAEGWLREGRSMGALSRILGGYLSVGPRPFLRIQDNQPRQYLRLVSDMANRCWLVLPALNAEYECIHARAPELEAGALGKTLPNRRYGLSGSQNVAVA